MANIKKNFNFRNGVQVDDDNLLVTETGLVGIGTTIPVEALDVRGNVVVTGFTSTTTAQIGVLTVTTFVPNQITGAGLSVFSGIVTAQGAGILTYFGDARNLQGMPTSQWEDKDVGLGFTSIYNTGGNVGVGTEDPRTTFQVGNNVDAGEKGVGISSVGNINMTGILTATSLIGNLTGDVTGRITGDVVGNINSTGVSTAADLKVTELDVDGHTNLDNVNISGLTTFINTANTAGLRARTFAAGSGLAVGELRVLKSPDNTILQGGPMIQLFTDDTPAPLNGPGTTDTISFYTSLFAGQFVQDGTLELNKNFKVTGVSTFTGLSDFNGGATVDNIQIGITGDNEIDTTSGNLTIDSAGGTTTIDDILSVTGSSTFSDDIGVVGLTTTKTLLVTGITTLTGNVDASYVGASSTVFATKLGVGTTQAPVNDIQVRKSGDVEVQITSESGTAGLTIGRETGNADTNNSEIRYGKVSAGAPYSSAQSLDILNYGTGNFNYHLSANSAGAVDGDFHWHKGLNNSRMMTLTGIGGSLGIGITTPSTTLHVIGQATVSGNVVLGGDLDVTGNAALNVIGQVTGDLTGNVNATSGVSTFKRLDLDTTSYYEFGELSASSIGIGTTMGNFSFVVNPDADKRFTVSNSGNVGVKTDETFGNGFYVSGSVVSNTSIAIGSTQATSAVDFKNAGQGGVGANANRMYMLPPQVNTAQRAALQGVVSGAVIYNTSLNKLQVYVGTGSYNVANWQNCN